MIFNKFALNVFLRIYIIIYVGIGRKIKAAPILINSEIRIRLMLARVHVMNS